MMLEVRCCCRPENLLGWLPVPERDVWNGARVAFRIPARVESRREQGIITVSAYRAEHIWLTVAHYQCSAGGPFRGHLAFKSDDTPLETLRRLPGFVEHHPASAEC
jgi:hypothetical protein